MAENKQAAGSINLQVGDKPPLANHDSSVLDLAFVMDVTGSMGSYIHAAQQSIRTIVEDIVSAEKSDIHLALVEYRDHPPQDNTFVTRTNDFTDSVKTMKGWLDQSSAAGGGDGPEAVADGLHDVLKLNWREEATKICVLIADAPPHGLMGRGDGFPNGCPAGLDPVVIINQMAEKNITVYSVGCEPAINQCRDFFMALAHITGGQYVPLTNANLLSKVIIGGAQEEITLQRLMEEVHEEVMTEMQAKGGEEELDEDVLAMNVHKKLAAKGAKAKVLVRNDAKLEAASDFAQTMASKRTNMADWKKEWDAAGKSDREPQTFAFGGEMRAMRSMCAPAAPGGGRGGAPRMMRRATKAKGAAEEMDDSDASDAPVMERLCSDAPMAMAACDGPGGAMPSFGAPAPPPLPADSYNVIDADLDLSQAKRMVKKSIAMNRKNFKQLP